MKRMIHAAQGVFFHRDHNGSVRLLVADQEFPTLDETGTPIQTKVNCVLDAETWSTIVAAVSAEGENPDTISRARALHGRLQEDE